VEAGWAAPQTQGLEMIPMEDSQADGLGMRLVAENAILRSEFEDQKETISRLTYEVEGMRRHLSGADAQGTQEVHGGSDASFMMLNDGCMGFTPGTRVEARWAQDDEHGAHGLSLEWMPAQIARANEDGTFDIEYDNGAVCPGMPIQFLRAPGQTQLDDSMRAGDAEVKTLQLALEQERRRHDASTQQWWKERRRLLDELSALKGSSAAGRRMGGGLPTVGEASEGTLATEEDLMAQERLMQQTSLVPPADRLDLALTTSLPGINRGNMSLVAPLAPAPCGLNIELSGEGYVAKRIRGCRQSVVMGSAPLLAQEQGFYYEVLVTETVNGWVGGIGIGVTRVPPQELKRMPDKAWRIPSTFIVGYWGCLFLDGREKRTRWKADTLNVGSRVGLLVTGDGRGDLIVFVDGVPVVRADDVLPTVSGLQEQPLYPVIDVFAATLAIELQPNAIAPSKPWASNPSPPGSPLSVARSVGSAASVGVSMKSFA